MRTDQIVALEDATFEDILAELTKRNKQDKNVLKRVVSHLIYVERARIYCLERQLNEMRENLQESKNVH